MLAKNGSYIDLDLELVLVGNKLVAAFISESPVLLCIFDGVFSKSPAILCDSLYQVRRTDNLLAKLSIVVLDVLHFEAIEQRDEDIADVVMTVLAHALVADVSLVLPECFLEVFFDMHIAVFILLQLQKKGNSAAFLDD